MKVDEKAPIEGNSRTRSHLEDSNNAGAAAMETLEIGEEVVLKGVAWSHEYLIEYPIRGADEQVGELPMKVPYGGLEEVRIRVPATLVIQERCRHHGS